MGHTLLFVFFTLICTPGLGAVTLIPSENPVAEGHNVTISLSEPIPITVGLWLFGPSSLFLWYPGDFIPGHSHQDGILFNTTTYELTLQSVTRNSSGLYVLEELKPNKTKLSITLDVQELVKNIIAAVNTTTPVEYNDTVAFTCSAGGLPQWFSWQNASAPLAADGRVHLSNGGQNLLISNVTRYDKGPFKCVVANNVSSDESITMNLTISYGPDSPQITTLPQRSVYISGSVISLSCSADSSPVATFYWMFNNNLLNAYGQSYNLSSATQNQTGQYTCVAHNAVTLRYTSVTTTLHIVDPISAVEVKPLGSPVEGMPFNQSCHVVGPVNSIQWMRNGEHLYANHNISFSSDNSTLSFSQLALSDDALYRCTASNEVSNMTSLDYNVLVNYGPYSTAASGPVVAAAGSNVTFTCSSDSRPGSHYRWWFSDSMVADGPVFMTKTLSVNHSGLYTCMTFNPITGKNSSASVNLTVLNPVSDVMMTMDKLPIFGQTFTLTCHASGYVDHFFWMKNGVNVNNGSAALNFSSLSLADDGTYTCEAINAVSNGSSQPFDLKVFYGPWNTTVSGKTLGAVGSSMTFSCSADSHPESHYSWWFNSSKVGDSPVYSTGVLSADRSGLYTCEASNNITGLTSSASLNLTVIYPVSNVTVDVGSQHPIFGQPFQLTCSASGHVEHIQWTKNHTALYPGNGITFSSGNSTLSFQNLTFDDNGLYGCEASNAVNNALSPLYKLIINYGPWNTTVKGPSLAETGSSVTFSCSADSYPQSQFSWWLNSSQLGSGPVFQTGALSLNHSGHYTCSAVNGITGHNSSASLKLEVIDVITTVEVVSNNLIPLASQPLQLTCKVSGPYLQLYWLHNGHILPSSPRVSISADNTSVTFKPLQTADNGLYQCVAANILKEHFSPAYDLQAVFGPQSVQIVVHPGLPPKLTCQAVSYPAAVYQWITTNNTVVGNQETITLSLQSILGSNYTCVAKNPLTNVTVYTSQVIGYPSAAVNVHPSVVMTTLIALLLPVLRVFF